MDRRTQARVLAMQAIFQLDAQGEAALSILEKFFSENTDDDLIHKLAKEWALGAWNNLAKCDELIQSAAVKWQLARISAVERSILRICTYQMAFCEEIPHKVIINEGIELAKTYSTKQSAAFVNGVLDAIMRNIKADNTDE